VKFICTHEQLEKMKKVIVHNGGELIIDRREPDGVFAVARKIS